MKKWKCTVCGYIHTGDEPPDECPVCGADRSEFVEITGVVEASETVEAEVLGEETAVIESAENELTDTELARTEPVGAKSTTLFDKLTDLMLQNHVHPIAVHTPNGIVPAAVVFLLLAYVLNVISFELAAFYNIIFVLLAMPVVLFSGMIEWQKHYKGARTSVFIIKIICGAVVLFSLSFLIVWRVFNPEVASPDSPVRWVYFLVHVICLGAVGLAGHLGGKLVFGRK